MVVALFSFSGSRNFDADEMAKLLFIVTHVYDRLSRLTLIDQTTKVTLSDLEAECLQLTAGGKKGNEIASILDITEIAANNYIGSAAKKLGCSNRTQAVVVALRLGLIRVTA